MPREAPVTTAVPCARVSFVSTADPLHYDRHVYYMMCIRYNVKHGRETDGGDCMKVTREQAQENRERVLDAASALFRERGFHGIGVADLMKEAGLTHGAFYGQFSSKEDLMAEAC